MDMDGEDGIPRLLLLLVPWPAPTPLPVALLRDDTNKPPPPPPNPPNPPDGVGVGVGGASPEKGVDDGAAPDGVAAVGVGAALLVLIKRRR